MTQQMQTLEVVRFCPCKCHGSNACGGLKYVHPDRNLLLEAKKPPFSSDHSKGYAAASEGDLPRLPVSQALFWRYVCYLILSFELVIILSWHALFPNTSVFMFLWLFLRMYEGGRVDLAFCLASSKAYLTSLINNGKITGN